MFKKALAVILAGTMLLSFVGCGNINCPLCQGHFELV